jgi:hypothetical protein
LPVARGQGHHLPQLAPAQDAQANFSVEYCGYLFRHVRRVCRKNTITVRQFDRSTVCLSLASQVNSTAPRSPLPDQPVKLVKLVKLVKPVKQFLALPKIP